MLGMRKIIPIMAFNKENLQLSRQMFKRQFWKYKTLYIFRKSIKIENLW